MSPKRNHLAGFREPLEAGWASSWGRAKLPLRQPFVVSGSLSCSVGPLHSDLEYTVTSQKEGFVLTAVEGTVGDFKAYALAGVSFEVMHFKGTSLRVKHTMLNHTGSGEPVPHMGEHHAEHSPSGWCFLPLSVSGFPSSRAPI